MLDCFKKIPAICPGYGPITGFDRKNLSFEVRQPKNKLETLLQL